jgi:hypothetical protein
MQENYDLTLPPWQASPQISAALRQRLGLFVAPVLAALTPRLDVRLVRTFLATLEAILTLRHRNNGLLLSELGGNLLGYDHAPAGTKRLSNLLRSDKWKAALLETFLWRQAEAHRKALEEAGQEALVLWDESVLEKNESRAAEGLCPVRSSKAARCLKVKPGYYHPPTQKPIFVPGMHWVGLLLCGYRGAPTLSCLRWWSSRGEQATSARRVQSGLLTRCANAWGRLVLHVFDRGYCGSPWLGRLLEENLRFVVRWPLRYRLYNEVGILKKTWQIVQGKKTRDTRQLWDARRQTYRVAGVVWAKVGHPEFPDDLWLVVSRPGKGLAPWYLLTSEPIEDSEAAWRIVLAYARRWQIEMAFRYGKSELALESPRLWEWERRMKLLLMATLCYAFLLSLLEASLHPLCQWLLRHFCHRTGKRSQQAQAPLYRLRAALSHLWLSYPANLSQNSG